MTVEWVRRPTTEEVTAEFCRRLHQLTSRLQGACPVALTGGESAAVFYDAWASSGVEDGLRFYWSDERVVPPNDPDSNVKLAADHLLRPAQVEARHIHPPDTGLGPKACAAAYAGEVRHHVEGPAGTPLFPLIILGLGEDGHTGSLFPGRDPYEDDDLMVRAVEGTPDHPHARITFTPRLINAAHEVWFVVTGASKDWAVEQLEQRRAPARQVPSLIVDPNKTRITVFRT